MDKQEPSFFGLAHPDISMRDRLMHAGAGVTFGFIIGVPFFIVFVASIDPTLSGFLFCISASMAIFALIGLTTPKWLVDTFMKSMWYLP